MPSASSTEHSITVDAPPEEVWPLVTEGDELSTWLGDGAELEPVEGGDGHVIDDDGVLRRIHVEEVDEGRSITWTWWPDGDPDDVSTVEITLEPGDDGTTVHVIESVPVAAHDRRGTPSSRFSDRVVGLELQMLCRSTVLV